ncbi:MAG: hypothetical protein QM723_25115 [Myxococcaceae bacterium]
MALLGLAACHQRPLQHAGDQLALSEQSLVFGEAYAGRQAIDRAVIVHNVGTAMADVSYETPGAPFELLTAPEHLNSGDTVLRLRFRPVATGSFDGKLKLKTSNQALELSMSGTGSDLPPCGQPEVCHDRHFDVQANACLDTVLPDGTSCDTHDLCASAGACSSGRCVGKPVDCDDHNPCTLDTCNPFFGCEHIDGVTCPAAPACMKAVCDPTSGCSVVAMDDGSPCGKLQTCTAADVCLGGSCVTRVPPDGYTCQPLSPCQGEGHCMAQSCSVGPVTPIVEKWRFDSLDTQDAGDPDSGVVPNPVALQDFVLDEGSNEISLSGFFSVPVLRANTPDSFDAPNGAARRCLLWNGQYVCADYPGGVNGQVTVINRVTGVTQWTFSLAAARPDFAAMTSNLFMGRMTVLGADRLAALFEGYLASNTTSTENCRLYFLTVLDASGALITSTQLTDSELTSCDHPHPYGFSSDTTGNFFVGFAPTSNINAGPPLHPAQRTTFMSFTRDGNFRWKFTDVDLVGGEIAVANGALYPENSEVGYDTGSGNPLPQLPENFGRAAVTGDRLVLAPLDGYGALDAYQPATNTGLWTHTLASGRVFWGDQLRLARWKSLYGEATVAVTFTSTPDGGAPMLHAIDISDGTQAFECPIVTTSRGAPQLLEIGDGGMSLMAGGTCEKCDPPFATSSAGFHSFDVPTLSPASNVSWPGTFGGAGHDGEENVVYQSSAPGGL